MSTFDEANKKVHSVESQWHYNRMIEHGFTPITKSQIGLVRKYEYKNAEDRIIAVSTGYSSDHWTDLTTKDYGYHGTLTAHLEGIK